MKQVVLFAMLLLAPLASLRSEDQPNLLFITSEDNASQWIGCYGNKQSQTPRINALAKEGLLFENAFANAPVCAVSRATILMGAYSPTMGTQHMRSRHTIPQRFRPNVEYLRAAGYYCTNNNKTDYNFKGNDNSYWNASSGKAHYKNRPSGKPFYAVFNINASHESSLFVNTPAEPKRLKPEEVDLPPYLPDLPEIRKDIARYHDRISDMDAQVGKILDDLEKAGLAENTIVIYCSDHGGILPRGKRYLENTGVKIPFIVRIPEKFQKLSPFKRGARVAEPVSFVDLSPTFLSLIGKEKPSPMQGRAFLGNHRVEPAADEMEFLYADRFDELYGMRRGLTDGKWKYIRNFNPDFPTAPYSFYQFGQPGWKAYQKAWQDGKLKGIHQALWEAPGSAEQLYDLTNDPWELHNLAKDPAHQEKLKTLRAKLKATMVEIRDTGFVPEPLFDSLAGSSTISEHVHSASFEINKIADLAFAASAGEMSQLPDLKKALTSENVLERYWGLVGLRILGDQAKAEVDSIASLLKDKHPVIRATAAEATFVMGKKDLAATMLINELSTPMNEESLLYLLNILRRLELLDQIPQNWQKAGKTQAGGTNYTQRFIESALGH